MSLKPLRQLDPCMHIEVDSDVSSCIKLGKSQNSTLLLFPVCTSHFEMRLACSREHRLTCADA